MTDEAFESFARVGRAASSMLPSERSWKWEDRLMTAVVVLDTIEIGEVLSTLRNLCGECWNSENVAECSPDIGALVTEMAGLRPGQFLFAQKLDRHSFAYFTTWPWDDRQHVSIRFGVYYPAGQLTDYAMSNLVIKRGLNIG